RGDIDGVDVHFHVEFQQPAAARVEDAHAVDHLAGHGTGLVAIVDVVVHQLAVRIDGGVHAEVIGHELAQRLVVEGAEQLRVPVVVLVDVFLLDPPSPVPGEPCHRRQRDQYNQSPHRPSPLPWSIHGARARGPALFLGTRRAGPDDARRPCRGNAEVYQWTYASRNGRRPAGCAPGRRTMHRAGWHGGVPSGPRLVAGRRLGRAGGLRDVVFRVARAQLLAFGARL